MFAPYRGGGISALVDARHLSVEDSREAVQHQFAGLPRTFTVQSARRYGDAVRLTGTLEGELGKNVQSGPEAHANLAGEEATPAGIAIQRFAVGKSKWR